MPNITKLTVRYAETDQMGVVHHATYPIWFEMARTDYIKALGMSYANMEEDGVMLPVTGITCKYKIPAKYDDEITITARITRLNVARIEFCYEAILPSGEVACEGTSSHAFVDKETFKPINFKKRCPEFFEVLEKCAKEDETGFTDK